MVVGIGGIAGMPRDGKKGQVGQSSRDLEYFGVRVGVLGLGLAVLRGGLCKDLGGLWRDRGLGRDLRGLGGDLGGALGGDLERVMGFTLNFGEGLERGEAEDGINGLVRGVIRAPERGVVAARPERGERATPIGGLVALRTEEVGRTLSRLSAATAGFRRAAGATSLLLRVGWGWMAAASLRWGE